MLKQYLILQVAYLQCQGEGDEDAKQEHTAETHHVQRSPAQPVHQRNRHQCHGNHDRAHSASGVNGGVLLQTGAFEEAGGVVEDLKTRTRQRA